MQTTWKCLTCSHPMAERDDTCPRCRENVELQYHQGPDLYALAMGLDLEDLRNDDDYRKMKARTNTILRRESFAKWREQLAR